jgi:DNA polymerase-3 subunit alpha
MTTKKVSSAEKSTERQIIKQRDRRPQFIHLRAHSAYSLSEGAIGVKDLVRLTSRYRMPAIALTDTNNLFGSLEFSLAAAGAGIQPIIGCVMHIREGEDRHNKPLFSQLVLLAKNDVGYQNLLQLTTQSFEEGKNHTKPSLELKSFEGLTDGLIALSGGPNGVLGFALQHKKATLQKRLETLIALFEDHLYIELQRHGTKEEAFTESHLIELAHTHDIPLVATNDVYFDTPDKYNAHDVLICISEGRYISEEDRKRFTREHFFKSAKEMHALFKDVPEALQNTVTIAKRCSVMSELRKPILPSFPCEDGRTEADELKAQSERGLQKRLEHSVFTDEMSDIQKEEAAKPYFDRLAFELKVITGMQFPGYFLIVSDFIRWAKANEIPVGPGRGSGAGSVVAWALDITNLDPLRFGLLFERFLNPERVSMPDFDIDFCPEGRDKVIHYVQEKYGVENVAQIITFGKLQARAVLRDVGRVLQMPYGQVDRICKMIPFNPAQPVTLSEAVEMDPDLKRTREEDEQVAQLIDIGLKLEGLYRHASTHAAGVVIGDRPLHELIPVYYDPKSDMRVTGYSMKHAEMAGLVKFDFLGLKTLTVIDQTCKLIRENGQEIDIDAIPIDDPASYKLLSDGQTTGVFQMESAGMRDALRKMKPDTIEDIIALISLYRPGPMENIPTYIARKHGKETPDYMHEKLEETLKETYGVIIYQEQVMQIAQILGGYTLGGADLLRRAMGKKIKEEMDAQREIFLEGSDKNNVPKKQANEIFDKVAKFAGYGFNKSHAAAYAMIGYQTAYLKANHPVEFYTASMNIDIGDTDKIDVFRCEAQRNGITILPPEINASNAKFSTEKLENPKPDGRKRGIRYALGALKNVGLAAMTALQEEREAHGPFASLFDIAERCESKVLNKRQVENLSKSGAIDALNANRRQVFEGAQLLTRYAHTIDEEKNSNQSNLFSGVAESSASRPVLQPIDDWSSEEKMQAAFEALGFYLTSHPLDKYMEELDELGILTTSALEEKSKDALSEVRLAGVATGVSYRANNGRRFAYIQFSDPVGSTEVSVFDEKLLFEKREVIEDTRPLLITAEIRRDEGGIRIAARNIQLLDDYLATKKMCCFIHLESPASLPAIKARLDNDKKGRHFITFQVSTPQKLLVNLSVSEAYALEKEDIQAIAAMEGVANVRQAQS